MRIVILHDIVGKESSPDQADALQQAGSVSEALVSLGHETVPIACGLNLASLRRDLLRLSPDLVFNLVESLDGRGRMIHAVPFLLDSRGIPYTGSSSEAIYLTSNKITAKERMNQWGIPTSPWIGPYSLILSKHIRLNPSEKLSSPSWIVKSVWEHASVGLDYGAIVHSDTVGDVIDCLKKRAPEVPGDCFAECYIEGREFNLSLLEMDGGPVVLPPAEIVFKGFRGNQPRIVGYKAKWDPQSFEYAHTSRCFDFPDMDLPLIKLLEKTALECWDLFCLNGYARVDFRVDENGVPWVLEINANPCISPDAGFAAALERAGIPYTSAVDYIVQSAFNRVEKPSVPEEPGPFLKEQPPNIPFEENSSLFRYDTEPDDVFRIHDLLSATGFFHEDEVIMATELIEENLAKGPLSGYFFVFCESRSRLFGYTCFGPIPCTQSSYDLYWIAVHPDFQNEKYGQRLMAETERLIAEAGGRRIYADTSGRPQYEKTRLFYERCGYEAASLLPDFYGPKDDKVIYQKNLGAE